MTQKAYSDLFIVEVVHKQQAKQFIDVHNLLNKTDPNWIRPLDKDINSVFDPEKNKFFRKGQARRWLVRNEDGEWLGRIAAFINPKYTNKGDTVPIGGIGFFDCIDDQPTANLLFDTAKTWLASEGMQGMDGPINFGERDKFWGLLIEGFKEPLYGMNYNPAYYRSLFEGYGFELFYEQLCFHLELAKDSRQLSKKFYKAHAKFASQPDFKVVNITKKNLRHSATDFSIIYNKAWAGHGGNKTISAEKAYKLFQSMKPIMNDYIGWLTYYNETPIALWVNMPDLNQIFRHLNGQMNLWAKIKFLYLKHSGISTRLVGIVYGVIPEFQGTGVDYYMIVEAEEGIKKHTNFRELELQWIGAFNPKMVAIAKNLDGVVSRKLATFRKFFDENQPFTPHPTV